VIGFIMVCEARLINVARLVASRKRMTRISVDELRDRRR
jgi:hypothetical protein